MGSLLRSTCTQSDDFAAGRAGDATSLPNGQLTLFDCGSWLPDGKRILFSGFDGRQWRTYKQYISEGEPHVIGDMFCPSLSRDGSSFAASYAPEPDNRGYALYSVEAIRTSLRPARAGR